MVSYTTPCENFIQHQDQSQICQLQVPAAMVRHVLHACCGMLVKGCRSWFVVVLPKPSLDIEPHEAGPGLSSSTQGGKSQAESISSDLTFHTFQQQGPESGTISQLGISCLLLDIIIFVFRWNVYHITIWQTLLWLWALNLLIYRPKIGNSLLRTLRQTR